MSIQKKMLAGYEASTVKLLKALDLQSLTLEQRDWIARESGLLRLKLPTDTALSPYIDEIIEVVEDTQPFQGRHTTASVAALCRASDTFKALHDFILQLSDTESPVAWIAGGLMQNPKYGQLLEAYSYFKRVVDVLQSITGRRSEFLLNHRVSDQFNPDGLALPSDLASAITDPKFVAFIRANWMGQSGKLVPKPKQVQVAVSSANKYEALTSLRLDVLLQSRTVTCFL